MSKNVDDYLMNLIDARDEEIRQLRGIIKNLNEELTNAYSIIHSYQELEE